jgi:predicted HTH domain antitoxin
MKYEMSKIEALRITVVDELQASHITNARAAQLLGLSVRQIQQLKAEATATKPWLCCTKTEDANRLMP